MKRTNGVGHALLIVGYNAERKRFVAVDPSPRGFQGDTVRTYELSFAQNRQRVMRCPYAKDLEGAKVLQVYQWYWKKQKKNRRGAKGLNTRKKDGEEAVSIAQRGQKGNFARPQTRTLSRAITPSSVLNTAM